MGLDKYKKALKIICNNIKSEDTYWALTGSVNLALQAVDVKPNDLDILTDKSGAEKIKGKLGEYKSREFRWEEDDDFKSWRGLFDIKGVEVEILGDVRNDVRGNFGWGSGKEIRGVEYVEVSGYKVPCMSLEEEYKVYKRLKRDKKVRKIRKRLEKFND